MGIHAITIACDTSADFSIVEVSEFKGANQEDELAECATSRAGGRQVSRRKTGKSDFHATTSCRKYHSKVLLMLTFSTPVIRHLFFKIFQEMGVHAHNRSLGHFSSFPVLANSRNSRALIRRVKHRVCKLPGSGRQVSRRKTGKSFPCDHFLQEILLKGSFNADSEVPFSFLSVLTLLALSSFFFFSVMQKIFMLTF
ncbi:hypothetical protein CEXT_77961 [Caerostris extrusa]|uniref:Uncharacterized protein n=1 Tax=Caerostris extrusa TaxID=172846 RepID=A0AAV4Q0F9_CAEEX|nr:hypothetical protein CEXT_77961 [Caerostris extrusa]